MESNVIRKLRIFALGLTLVLSLLVKVSAHEGLPTNLSPIYSAENTVPLMRFGYGWANDIAWSPDGSTLAVATSIGVWLYDASDLQAEPVLLNETVFNARAVKYSSDGRLLVAGGSGLHLWNTTNHELIRSFDTESVLDLAFSPDNSQILSSHSFGSATYGIDVWDIATGRVVTVLSEGVFSNLGFSPDGSYFAAVRLSDCCFSSYIWDTSTWNTLFSGDIEVRADDERIVFSPDSEILVAMDRTGSFTVLEAQSQTVITTVILDTETDEYYPTEAAFTEDGRLIGLSRSGILRIWDTESYTSVATLDLGWNPDVARLSPDGTQIAGINRSGSLRIWDSTTGNLIAGRDNFAVDDPVIAFSPDGRLLASGAINGEIWLWELATGEPAFILSGHEDEILSLDFSSDGAFLASASKDGTVRLWDVATGELSRIIADGEYTTVIIDSQNQVLLADDNLIQIHDLITEEPIQWFYDRETDSYSNQLELEGRITAVAFEGNYLAVAAADGQLHYWSPSGITDVTEDFYHLSINTVALVPIEDGDGFSLAYAGSNNVVLHCCGGGTSILSTHNSWIYALAANSQALASGGCAETKSSPWDGSPYCAGAELRLWTFTASYPDYGIISQEQGHTAPIRDATFNPAGTLLATVSDDGTILFWGNPIADD
jgi:WD40 repeat protein